MRILEAVKTTLRGIEKYGDLERYLESEGMQLEIVDHLSYGVAGVHGNLIAVLKDENKIIEKVRILHEWGHVILHSLCIGYYQIDKILVLKKEREAETFASLVLFPSVEGFETEKDFIEQSGLPEKAAKLRINFFRKTGI